MFVLFEKSHRNGGTKVRYLEGGPFGPVLFPGITSLSRLNLLEFQHFMRFVSRKVPLLEKYGTDSAHVIASAVLLDVFINA